MRSIGFYDIKHGFEPGVIDDGGALLGHGGVGAPLVDGEFARLSMEKYDPGLRFTEETQHAS